MTNIFSFAPHFGSPSLSDVFGVNERAIDIFAVNVDMECDGRSGKVSFGTGVGVDGEDGVGNSFNHVRDYTWRVYDVTILVFRKLAGSDADAEGKTGEVWRDGHLADYVGLRGW